MTYENNEKKQDSVYSSRIRAGKRRTYFFDVRETRGNDYYLTITESRKKFNEDGYDRHKIFLYKEDFNKFIKGLGEAIDYVKTELMPDFDFDAFNHDTPYEGEQIREGVANDNPETVLHGGPAVDAPLSAAPDPTPIIDNDIKNDDNTDNDTDATPHEEVDKW
ncbi:hypothetical protein BH09BAC2_BH09BAC2_20700 [soil metagenome]